MEEQEASDVRGSERSRSASPREKNSQEEHSDTLLAHRGVTFKNAAGTERDHIQIKDLSPYNVCAHLRCSVFVCTFLALRLLALDIIF